MDDFVNIMDLAPTFLEAAGVPIPDSMTAKSLLPIFESDKVGQVDATRTFVVTGRERHVGAAREGNLPYPQRAIRTKDFLYIHNFEPGRWPMGDPRGLDDPNAPSPPYERLRDSTFVAYSDLDASPTKAWMIHHRAEEAVRTAFDLGFGLRPREELYDLRVDADQMDNVASDRGYEEMRAVLEEKLMGVLREENDPRVVESPPRFEREPYAGE